jgi:cytochrome c oxidase assembly factor CtaG
MLTSVDLPIALTALAALLYVLGERRATRLRGRPRGPRERWRSLSFALGLATILAALVSPIDTYADKLFWVHMVQHVLLLTVAPPLIVLAAPWSSIWRPLPLGARRSVARTVSRSPGAMPLRALARRLGRPAGAFLAFNVNLVVWHIPAAYDLTLRDEAVHDCEHLLFLLTGILLWAQVIDSPPLRARLSAIGRVYYMVATAVIGWIVSLVLAFASSPLYAAYADLAHRPGGISALADQQIAAGVMLVPGSLTISIFVFIQLYRWLAREERDGRPPQPARVNPPAPGPPPPGGEGETPATEHALV